jgi:hypothetical protein
MVMSRHAGYCGSHVPSVSRIDSLPSASSCNNTTEVNALVLLPTCHSESGGTGVVPPYCAVPAVASMLGFSRR